MAAFDVVAINGALCNALGLDPAHIKNITIRLTGADVPRVEVEYSRRFLQDHPEFEATLANFRLVPADDDE